MYYEPNFTTEICVLSSTATMQASALLIAPFLQGLALEVQGATCHLIKSAARHNLRDSSQSATCIDRDLPRRCPRKGGGKVNVMAGS